MPLLRSAFFEIIKEKMSRVTFAKYLLILEVLLLFLQ